MVKLDSDSSMMLRGIFKSRI